MLAWTWPDWAGQAAVIVGTGPSATAEPLEQMRGLCRFVVIKSSWELAPWADVLYGIDLGWWIANQGVAQFKGLKVSPSPTVCKAFKGVRQVKLRPRAHILIDQYDEHGLLILGCGLRSGGGHSGFQAINLAVQFGAKRIVLVGFDMTLAHGAHWHQEGRGVARADAGRIATWREEMDACAPLFESLGVTVINAAMESALTQYQKLPLTEAIYAAHPR